MNCVSNYAIMTYGNSPNQNWLWCLVEVDSELIFY